MVFPPLSFWLSCESVWVNGHDFVAHEMSRPFLVELRMPMSNTPRRGVRNYDFPFPCRLARQASAGPAGYAVKERGQPAHRIAVLSKLTSFPALSRAWCPATKEIVCRLAAALSNFNRNAPCKSAARPRRSRARARGVRGRRCRGCPPLPRRAGSGRRGAGACPSRERARSGNGRVRVGGSGGLLPRRSR